VNIDNKVKLKYIHGFVFLIIILSLLGCQSSSELSLENKIQLAENSLPQSNKIITWKKKSIPEQMKHYGIPGVSIAVIENFELLFARVYGIENIEKNSPLTTETMFRAVGVSSQVSRFIALNFVEREILNMQEDVNQNLITWKIPDNQWTQKQVVTLDSLLKFNTAGLNEFYMKSYTRGSEIPSLYQVLEGLPPAKTPPVRVVSEPSRYKRAENLWVVSYIVLEQLLEDVAQKSFPQIANDLLFSPLGLKNTTFEQPLPERFWPQTSWGHQKERSINGSAEVYPTQAAMGLWSTPTDLAHILIEMMKSYRGLSSLVASPDTMKQLINLDKPYYHWNSNGSGYSCFYAFDARAGQGIVIMINHDAGPDLRIEITHSFCRSWNWRWGDFLLKDRMIYSAMIYAALGFFLLIILLGTVLSVRQSRQKLEIPVILPVTTSN